MKQLISGWNTYERCWLVVFCGLALWISRVGGDSLFGFAVFLSGVFCVILAAKGSILNYPAGMFNTVGYAWLSWQNGLYGEMSLNMLFYLPMMVAGWIMWRKHVDKGGIVAMRKLPVKTAAAVSAASIAAVAGLGFILSLLNGQNTPYIDASTNVFSIAATLLMVRRCREQWAAYIVVNALSVVMWSLRAASGSPEGPLMIVMWSAYLVNSFYGFYNWTRRAA